MTPTLLRDQVRDIIRNVAEAEILPRFRNLASHEITAKTHPGDLVTAADMAAEAALEGALETLMPGSLVVGEEGAEADPAVLGLLSTDAPVWILDPVDGTGNFARGEACFAVIVALAQGGDTVAGWIHDPLADRTVWAHVGEGAWADDGNGNWTRLTVAPMPDAADSRGSASQFLRNRLGTWPGELVRYQCVGREYMDLVMGAVHFADYGGMLKPWDHAAGVRIHAEAGGYCALIDDMAPYRPVRIVKNARLLLAPDEKTWHSLRKFMADA